MCAQRLKISLGIHPVWSESSLCGEWVPKDLSFLHADREDSDQTWRMPRLIWVFAGRTAILLVLSRGSSDKKQQDTLKVCLTTYLFWEICGLVSQSIGYYSHCAGCQRALIYFCHALFQTEIYEPHHKKTCLLEIPTRSDSNWPAQLLKLAWGLKFWLQKLETSHYLGNEQQRRWSDCADAYVVRIWHKTLFSHGPAHIENIQIFVISIDFYYVKRSE